MKKTSVAKNPHDTIKKGHKLDKIGFAHVFVRR